MKAIDQVILISIAALALGFNAMAEPPNGVWGDWEFVGHYARSEDCEGNGGGGTDCAAYVCVGYDEYVRFCEFDFGSSECMPPSNETTQEEGGYASCESCYGGACYCSASG